MKGGGGGGGGVLVGLFNRGAGGVCVKSIFLLLLINLC